GRAAMVTASAVRTYRPTPVSRAASGANGSSARPSSGVDVGNRAKKNRVRAHISGCITLSSVRIAVRRRLARPAGAEKVRVRRERELAVAQEGRLFPPPPNRAPPRGPRERRERGKPGPAPAACAVV